MKAILIFFISLAFMEARAQSCTDISYRFEFKRSDWMMKARYVYNDSTAFFYFYTGNNNPLKHETVFSKKLIQHAMLTEKYSGIKYDEVNYPEGNRWLIKDSLKKEEWQPTGISKMILNITCDGYLRIEPTGDSTLAYVSTVLGDGKGLLYCNGLPGVALEIYNQSTAYHVIATSIDKMDCRFQLPDVPQISRKDYDPQLKNK